IAFLLIIFFILTSNFMREKDVKADPARAVDVVKLEQASVSVILDEDGALWLDGEECDVNVLESLVTEELEGKTERRVMLKVDKRQPHSAYAGVLLALSRAEVEIELVGQREEQ
ncbi:MAG: ExbD/TolR family protein, partial [Planctomycetota bacterium]